MVRPALKSYSVPSAGSLPTGMPWPSRIMRLRPGQSGAGRRSCRFPAADTGWAPAPYGHGVAPELVALVRTDRPGRPEFVVDAQVDREGPARLRTQGAGQACAACLLVRDLPRHPAHEAMNRVVLGGLGERQLVADAVKAVTPVPEPVRPRDQMVPARSAAPLVQLVAVKYRPPSTLYDRSPAPTWTTVTDCPANLQHDLSTRRRPDRGRRGPAFDAPPVCPCSCQRPPSGWRDPRDRPAIAVTARRCRRGARAPAPRHRVPRERQQTARCARPPVTGLPV